jgi:CHAT domain-containing protein
MLHADGSQKVILTRKTEQLLCLPIEMPLPQKFPPFGSNGVRYAVINACESARSDRGVRGNLAKTFVKEGMVAVLATSYKLSVGAVSLFTRQFYEAFLQRNLPFARAAHITRQAMRNQPQRTGRFVMLVDLEDWIVPVVYCSTDDDNGVRVGKPVSRVHRRLLVFFCRTDDSLVLKPTVLGGRDADILKLEERLLDNSRKELVDLFSWTDQMVSERPRSFSTCSGGGHPLE